MALPPCENHYDLFVIGCGPAGQKGAIAAAKLGKRVGIADGKLRLGGSCLHLGTIPSKTLREAVLYLSGYRQKSFYGESYALKRRKRGRETVPGQPSRFIAEMKLDEHRQREDPRERLKRLRAELASRSAATVPAEPEA